MAREVWGTFSVKDHTKSGAFVAEVMLYDRLVIPVPPNEAERARWQAKRWQPERLARLLQILGSRACVVEWDAERQQNWKSRFDAGKYVAEAGGDWAFAATRTELIRGLPGDVTGIQAVTDYTSLSDLKRDIELRPAAKAAKELRVRQGAAVAILGHEFLVPDDPRWSPEDLLKQAVDLSSGPAFSRKRSSFWRWHREFLSDKGLRDQSGVHAAVEEMRDLLADEQAVVRKGRIRTSTRFAFLIASMTLALAGTPLTPLALGGAFVSLGEFAADKLLSEPEAPKPAALLRDIRKRFGWEHLK